MRILFVSYGVYEYDGRTRELMKVANLLGVSTFVTMVDSLEGRSHSDDKHIRVKKGKFAFCRFIFRVLKTSFRMKQIDILFIDNRRAIIPGLLIRLLKRPRIIIQDVRELYLISEVNHFAGKLGCIVERSLISRASVLICANDHRSEIMKEHFSLNEKPLVFENIRKLVSDDFAPIGELESKYGSLLQKKTFRIISTSGYSISRTNDKLVLAMKQLGSEFELFLVGGGSKRDRMRIEKIIGENHIQNVNLIGRVKENELKYLIQQCHLGVVNYNSENTNNRFCASGKIYEFLFEGLPVVTTENVTLVEFVNKYKVGIADNQYLKGIIRIKQEYDQFKKSVLSFVNILNVEENNARLAKQIIEHIGTSGRQ